MTIFGISTATPYTELALIHEGKVLFEDAWESNQNEAETLLPKLEQLLKKHEAHFQSLDNVFVAAGPGSFTGLRIGVTMANTLATLFNVRLRSLNTFHYLRAKLPPQKQAQTAITLRAGGQNLAIQLPESDKTIRTTRDEVVTHLQNISHVVTDIKQKDQAGIDLPKGTIWLQLADLNPLSTILLSPTFQEIPEHAQVQPIYLSAPHITKSKKQKFV